MTALASRKVSKTSSLSNSTEIKLTLREGL
jgi:hypothetical protein